MLLAFEDSVKQNLKARLHSNNPARILSHASLYLWKSWRHYPLTSWEDAESIFRHAYDAVEAEDRIEFIRALDDSFTERRSAHRA
jgi:hypothetical protein